MLCEFVFIESVNIFVFSFKHVFGKYASSESSGRKLQHAIFWSWQLALWNSGQLAPATFFDLRQVHGHHVWDIYVVD